MYVLPVDRDDVEALFGELGFRYHPDPMGRLEHGRWRDDDGREIEGKAPAALAGEFLLVADEKDKKKLRGTRHPKVRKAIERGIREDKAFEKRVREKPGWIPKKGYHRKPHSKWYWPDATTPSGTTVERKPDTPSGRRAAKRQTKIYREITGRRSKGSFYPVEDETGPKVRKATPRTQTESRQKYSVSAKISQNPYLEFQRRRTGGAGGYRVKVKGIRHKILLP